MNAYKLLLSFIISLLLTNLYAQNELTSKSTASLKRYAKAAERNGDYVNGVSYLEEYIKRKPKDQKAKYLLAQFYSQNRNYKQSYHLFNSLDKTKFPLAPFYKGEMEIRLGKYQSAVETFTKFRKSYRGEKDDSYYRRLAKDRIESAETADTLLLQKPRYIVNRLQGGVNKVYIEQSPLLINPNTLIYTSLRSDTMLSIANDGNTTFPKRTFHLAKKVNNNWVYQGPYRIHPFFNDYDISSACFSPNKDRLIVSACQLNINQEMICQLYELTKQGKEWIRPTKLPEEVNAKGTSNTQPTFAPGCKADREMLYFVSDRSVGKGGNDIYYSTYYIIKRTYRTARNAGMKINTKKDELSPYYDMESAQLFFSSEGHPGLGGFDLFSTQGYKGKWEEPVNIGAPINSAADDLFYSPSESGVDGFFTSNRSGGTSGRRNTCCDDLYQFTKIDSAYTLLNGAISLEGNSDEPVYVEVFIVNNEGEKLFVKRVLADLNGNYQTRLLPGKNYEVSTSSDGYLADQKLINLSNSTVKQAVTWSPVLSQINDNPIIIEDIQFEFNQVDLSKEARLKLDSFLLPLLVQNPTLVVEVGAHTDNKGTEAYNLNLSQRRAESIVKYLIESGIDKQRLSAKGYGESKPIVANEFEDGSDNPEGRAVNRRSELKVIGRIELIDED